jgi:hypothetical protein
MKMIKVDNGPGIVAAKFARTGSDEIDSKAASFSSENMGRSKSQILSVLL